MDLNNDEQLCMNCKHWKIIGDFNGSCKLSEVPIIPAILPFVPQGDDGKIIKIRFPKLFGCIHFA